MVNRRSYRGSARTRGYKQAVLQPETNGIGVARPTMDRWESLWAPYDRATYAAVLAHITADDHVLEIGAGDLRLSRMLAERAASVYAMEINEALVEGSAAALPENIRVIIGDARFLQFPSDVTVAILLMRHCTQFARYFDKLRDSGCRLLLTNARWGMGVETIDMWASRYSFDAVDMGWFACTCGNRGFKPGPAQQLTERNIDRVWELDSCPACLEPSGSGAFPII